MRRSSFFVALVAAFCASSLPALPPAPSVTRHAKGTFEVTLTPVPLADPAAGEQLARMTLEKQFSGDLVGNGKGEMLTVDTGVNGSAAYVAIERVTGTLDGHTGSFVLQHSGTTNNSLSLLSINVVANSGTGELAGLAGALQVKVVDGKHLYDFAYTLPH